MKTTGPLRATFLKIALVTAALATPLALPSGVDAQQAPAEPTSTADPADVTTLDDIMTALYDVISGPAGRARDWDRFYSLFLPEGARLIPSGRNAQGFPRHQVWTPEEYVANAGRSLEENGFFEAEIGRTVEEFGNVTHVFSAYDSRRTRADTQPFARGINSIQLYNDGTRYWIVSIFWDSERPGNPIPARYIN